MTKVLIITNKNDLTTDFVISRLQERDIPYYRLNTEDICQGLSITMSPQKGICVVEDSILGRTVDLLDFDSVYYRRPALKEYIEQDLQPGEQAFLTTELFYSLEGMYKMLQGKYWISPLYAIREAENKVYQLMLANQIGFRTPNTILTSNPVHLETFLIENDNDCVIKPVHNGRVMDGKIPEVVYTSEYRSQVDAKKIEYSPNYLQQKIHKRYDLRVTVVGNTLFPVRIESQDDVSTQTDWRKGQNILSHKPVEIPSDIEDKCIQLLRELRLRYAAIDFAVDKEGQYVFFEINPNGQWAWIEHLTGLPISEGIVNLLVKQNV